MIRCPTCLTYRVFLYGYAAGPHPASYRCDRDHVFREDDVCDSMAAEMRAAGEASKVVSRENAARLDEVGKTDLQVAPCICGDPLPAVPLLWGSKRFCSLACFASWYLVSGSDGSDGAPLAYRDYADHVRDCPTCGAADRQDQLCPTGAVLFDALDDDPDGPGGDP